MAHQVKDQSSHGWRTELPNIVIDLGLDPYAFRLYAHYKRIAGDGGYCKKTNKNLAAECGMSLRKLIDVKKELQQPFSKLNGKSLITVTERTKEDGSADTDLITIIDVWPENMKWFLDKQSDSGGGARHAPHVVHDMHEGGARGAHKEEPMKKIPFKKVNEGSMPSCPKQGSRKRPKADFVSKLNPEQRKLHDRLIKYKPEWGPNLESKAITYWLLEHQKGGVERVKEVLELYTQEVVKYRARGAQIESMGAFLRWALDNDKKPCREHEVRNKSFAEQLKTQHGIITVTKKYVRVQQGPFNKELYYTQPEAAFREFLEGAIASAQAYE